MAETFFLLTMAKLCHMQRAAIRLVFVSTVG